MLIDMRTYTPQETSTLVARGIEDVKFNELTLGDNIVMVDARPSILTFLRTSSLYGEQFKMHLLHSVGVYGESYGDYATMRTEEMHIHVLELPQGNTLVIANTHDQGSAHRMVFETFDNLTGPDGMPQHWYTELLINSPMSECMEHIKDNTNVTWFTALDGLSAYLCVPVGAHGHILVGREHVVKDTKRQWDITKEIYLITPQHCYSLVGDEEKILDQLRHLGYVSDSDISRLSEYDTDVDHLSKNPHVVETVNMLRMRWNFTSTGYDTFFQPIYSQDGIDTFYTINREVLYTHGDVVVSEYDVPTDIFRKSRSIYDYYYHDRQGVSPFDGEYYSFGELVEGKVTRLEQGVVFDKSYYIKLGDHYVDSQANVYEEDAEIVQSMKDMISLSQRLQR